MKKNIVFFSALGLFLAAMVSIAVVSCTKENDKVNNDAIVGTWTLGTTSFTFWDDYTGLYHGRGAYSEVGDYNFKYELSTPTSGSLVYTFNIIEESGGGVGYRKLEFVIIDNQLFIDDDGPFIKQ